jgi:ribonuclease R
LRELSLAKGSRLDFHELVERLGISSKDRTRFRHFLKELVREGLLHPAKGRGFRLDRAASDQEEWSVEGIVHRHRAGYGFLTVTDPEDGLEGDLFLPAREMQDIFDDDRLRAVPVPGRYGRLAGRVLRILERGRTSVTGVYEKIGMREHVLPDPAMYGEAIELLPGAVEPRNGEIVEVEIRRYPEGRAPAIGRIVEILGAPGELGTILETVIRKHGLRRRFPDDVLEEAAMLPAAVEEKDLAGRVDLRETPTFTIDGEDARDFDDAVSVRRLEDGYALQVSIADVAHYVRRGSPLDSEALERGTSAYFPDRVIPMLPERLSNGIASLVPGEDRLTLTVEMEFDRDGRRRRARVYESVIRSWGRWTYTGVAGVLQGEPSEGITEHGAHVLIMHELMARLRARRAERGSLDFDLPEPDIVLDATGRPEEILRSERNDAHRIIEEFMIAANEAVADWFVEHKRKTIFRTHAPPELIKIREFVEFARAYGHFPDFGGLASSKAIAEFLREIQGMPAERALNHLLLRSMMRAQYSEENTGHYGLASPRYLHFTSPIRRDPDLVVHRLTKAILHREPEPEDRASLQRIAKQSTERETAAMKCEYDVLDVIRAHFLSDKIGEEFEGIVSGVTEDGFFVELLDVYVEGMVRMQDLRDDWYRFIAESRTLVGKKSKRRFAIGDPVRVRVQAVHVAMGRVEFALVRGGGRPKGKR